MNSKTRQPSTIEKIDLLNEQAWQQRVDNSNLAHQLSKEAIDMAEVIGYDKGRAQGYRTFAFTLIRLSRHHEALEYLNKAMPLFEKLHDLDGQGSVNGYFGIIERSFGNYARSLDFLFKFSSLAKQTCNIESQALAYYHIGTTYKYLGDYEKALQYLLEGLSLGRTIHSGMSESMTLKLIGQIYFENEDYANAINYNLQSLELLKKSGDKWSEAGCLDNIGNIYCKLGDFQLGLTFCWQSLTLAQSIGDKKGEANSQFHLAEINKAQNEHAAALANAKQSLNIREAISDKKGQAEIYLFLGGLRVDGLNNNETDNLQIQYLNKALLIGEETGAQDMLSKIHHRFYRVYRGLNQFEKALEHLETANAIEKEIHSKAFNQKILNLEISHKIEQSKKEAEIYRLRNVELADLYQQTNQQKEEIQTTLIELKETQSQLLPQALPMKYRTR
jgi:tetratricopeptide (TPR) repeat protein